MNRTVIRSDFESIVESTHSRVRAYIAGMGIAAHEVDDLAQEVFLQLYKNLHKMPDDVEPERWLKGIAKNLCLNHIRRTARRGRLQRVAIAEILARTEVESEAACRDESLPDALEHCVAKLPAKSKKLLRLRYEDELTSERIAETMHSTAEAIRIALFRIRGVLKDCIINSLTTARTRWR